MRVLTLGLKGDDVRKWQSFLFGQGYKYVEIDGDFGADTEKATKAFQSQYALKSDGEVGNATYAAAALKGFPIVAANSAYPPKPDFPYPSNEQRTRMLGKFEYTRLNDGSIRIHGDWARKNVIMVHIPQLKGIEGAPDNCMIAFHQAGIEQLKALFIAWEKAGLLKYIKTWAGTFNPRMVRGSRTQVSNHAYGSAFDINAAWNGLGVAPPLANQTGTVVPLVKIANDHGFYWGGHYNSRKDGMHFELAVLNRFPKAASSIEINLNRNQIPQIVPSIQTSSAATAPAEIQPPASEPESSDAQRSEKIPPADRDAENNPSDNQAPPPIEVQQIKPETEPKTEVPGIKASFAGAITFLTTGGAGFFALFQGLQKEIVYGFFGASALVGIVFTINRFWYANREKERESAERMEREKRAHELQVLAMQSAMNKNLNTVQIVPQPIVNSDPPSGEKVLNL